MEQSPRDRRNHQKVRTNCSRVVAKQRYWVAVATERFDVLFDPLESGDDVKQSKIGNRLMIQSGLEET